MALFLGHNWISLPEDLPDSVRMPLSMPGRSWGALRIGSFLLLAGFALRWWWEPLHRNFGTYPSDIWYVYTNYGRFLQSNESFPIEYPAGTYYFWKLLAWLSALGGNPAYSYPTWLAVNAFVLGLLGLALLRLIQQLEHDFFPGSRAAGRVATSPTFLYFWLFNYDLPPLVCLVAALRWRLTGQTRLAMAALGLGTGLKIFPVVAAIPMLWGLHRRPLLAAVGAFLFGLCLPNLPLLLAHPDLWIFPYLWQWGYDGIPSPGRLRFALGAAPHQALILASLLGVLLWMRKRRSIGTNLDPNWLIKSSLFFLLLFVLAKGVFSPQYLLWFLPLVALLPGYPWKGLAYGMELLNLAEAFFLDYWRSGHLLALGRLRAVREAAILTYALCLFKEGPCDSGPGKSTRPGPRERCGKDRK